MIEKELLEKYLTEKKSGQKIAVLCGCSLSTVRHWMKNYGLKFANIPKKNNGKEKICTLCKELKPAKEFYRNNRASGHSHCKPCLSGEQRDRLRVKKIGAVKLKGGKCIVCGYDRYVGSFDFHHLDPTQKDVNISRLNRTIDDPILLAELDKCVLLCRNCHSEVHGDFINLNDYM